MLGAATRDHQMFRGNAPMQPRRSRLNAVSPSSRQTGCFGRWEFEKLKMGFIVCSLIPTA